MSDPVSALGGAVFDGMVRVEDAGPRGMLTLKGDLGDARLGEAVKALTGSDVPGTREARIEGETGAAWMAPDELLLLVPHAEAEAAVADLAKALGGTHHLAANVSDARAVIEVSGPTAREVLAKLTPADLDAAAFGPGSFRRTRIAQVPAAFWMRDAETIEIVCFRSVAQYVFDVLKAAARPGSGVGYF